MTAPIDAQLADMLKITTRSGVHHAAGTDRYRILHPRDNTREERRAGQLQIGDVLVGAGKIISIERLETRGVA